MPPLPSRASTHGHSHTHAEAAHRVEDSVSHVTVSAEAEDAVAELHRAITEPRDRARFEDLEGYLQGDEKGPGPSPLSVCFKSVTTYGHPGGAKPIKTLKDAIWRTLTLQDIYELTLKRLVSPNKAEDGHAIIRDFSGTLRNGQMML